jgi:hypothetical protein
MTECPITGFAENWKLVSVTPFVITKSETALSRRMVSSGFLQEPHGVTTQKTPFFIVTAVKTSNLTALSQFYAFIGLETNIKPNSFT